MKYLPSLLLVLFTLVTSAQEAVTFEKYEYDRTEADGCKAWFCGRFGAIKVEAKVIDVPDVTAKELYNKTKKWINETYKGGTDIILGDNENEYIRFEGYSKEIVYQYILGYQALPIYYEAEIRFRDGRYRWEYTSWRIADNNILHRGFFTDFKLLNKKGKAVKPEHVFALQATQKGLTLPINSLTAYILADEAPADDW